jgi:hypothetical protein
MKNTSTLAVKSVFGSIDPNKKDNSFEVNKFIFLFIKRYLD